MAQAPAELLTKVKRIIIDRLFLEVSAEALKDDESLTQAYGVDSVRLFDMVVGLEEDFGISFADEELVLENFDTAKAVAERVQSKLESK